jgi:hypothetical protein
MTTVYLALALGFVLPTISFAWDIAGTPRDGARTPRPKRMYEAPFRQPGKKLPTRPEGMASLKAEIALTPAGRHLVPDLPPPRKEHDDWRFSTIEWEIARDSFFADQPDDRAVIREWQGAGR